MDRLTTAYVKATTPAGTVRHAVPLIAGAQLDRQNALCGYWPPHNGAGWQLAEGNVTCAKCRRRLTPAILGSFT